MQTCIIGIVFAKYKFHLERLRELSLDVHHLRINPVLNEISPCVVCDTCQTRNVEIKT